MNAEEVLDAMKSHRVERMPVIDAKRLRGISELDSACHSTITS